MGKEELNAWAVMNYSMEDRGIQPAEPHVGLGLTQRNQTDRFLNGDLSYFGVSIRLPVDYLVHLELGSSNWRIPFALASIVDVA